MPPDEVADLERKRKNWRRTVVVHIEPTNDRVEHDYLTRVCVCQPEVEAVTEPGQEGFIVRHKALDGRK